jgi:hypothetical protein
LDPVDAHESRHNADLWNVHLCSHAKSITAYTLLPVTATSGTTSHSLPNTPRKNAEVDEVMRKIPIITGPRP